MPPTPAQIWSDSATILERSRGVFFAQWEELLRLRHAVINTADEDDIHDLRVASRRFRAVLELFYPFVAKGPKTELKKKVCKLTRILGRLRNIDEAVLFFQARSQTDVSGDDPLVTRAFSKLRSGELKRIEKMLKAFDHRRLDRIVRKMVVSVNEISITERKSISLPAYFSDVSIRRYLRIQQLLIVSTVPEHNRSRHALRIAIKKWRYFFEIISRILNQDYTHLLDLLKEYQSILGHMNDISEFGVLLGDLGLPPDERKHAEATLRTEDVLMLENFTKLVERKPLAYTFLI